MSCASLSIYLSIPLACTSVYHTYHTPKDAAGLALLPNHARPPLSLPGHRGVGFL